LTAEKRAEKANAVIRAGLVSHLARWMSDSVIQRLILQRTQLLDTQQKATSEMDALGERLETVHNRMQSRLAAYERQIADLEKKLDAKDEENRELIRMEIASIKRQMEAERARGEEEFSEDWRPGIS
jgi:predicted nuclease with TOPRIM domain